MKSPLTAGCSVSRWVLGCTGALLTTLAVGASARPFVVLGDSWGVLGSPSMSGVLAAEGFGSTALANEATGGSTAEEWNTGVFDIPSILAGHPDLEVVHLIVGGNDLLGGAPVIPTIVLDIVGVLEQIAAATPVPILYTGYDYLPNPPLPVPIANAAVDALIDGVAGAVAADPLLAGRVAALNSHGLMQVHFGIPQLGIPPFDPSLPDPSQPGPTTAFADGIHLTAAGYTVYAQNIFDTLLQCADGIDNDGDGATDLADPGCASGLDPFETDPGVACDDGLDNDGDGRVDFDPATFASPGDNTTAPAGAGDPGCRDAEWHTENPQCQNGEEDGGAFVDYDGGFNGPPGSTFGGTPGGTPDPGCSGTPWKDSESCGFGPELALLVPLLWRRRLARRR